MPLTLAITFGPPCAGDNHFTATGTLSSGQSRTIALVKPKMKLPPTADEIEAFLSVLLTLYAAQLSGTSAAAIKAAIEAKTLNLTVTG